MHPANRPDALPRFAPPCATSGATRLARLGARLAALCVSAAILCSPAQAAGPAFPAPAVPAAAPVASQFDITGFIQDATLDSAGTICHAADPRLAGGTVKVNGTTIVIPCNTVLQMPATSLTWAELFSLAPGDIGLMGGQTGLALADNVNPAPGYNGPLPSYEIRVQGNIVNGRYIAGLVFISQQSLNVGQGVINYIDYATGEIHVGGTPGVPAPSDTRIRLNDPQGRYGKSHGGPSSGADVVEAGYDVRFTADLDNPTVHADTGYPLCIPRSNPFDAAGGDDPLCPQYNRPKGPACKSLPAPFAPFGQPAAGQFCKTWMMDPPPAAPCMLGVACGTDPTRQAPLEVGDSIDFIGTLKVDPVSGPYISAHTIVGHLGIYTTPGTLPVYVSIEGMLAGTGAQPVANLNQEATSRVKVEGFTTDPTHLVDIYAVDINPITGNTTDRLLGSANPSGPPVVGRFRFLPGNGAFLPATKEMRVVSRAVCDNGTAQGKLSPCSSAKANKAYANGLFAGQYRAPNFEFIFAENILAGDALVPNNLQDLAFLFCGSGPLTTPTAGGNPPVVGQLSPAPWAPPMPTPAFAPTLCPNAPIVGAAAVTPSPVGVINPPLVSVPNTITANAGALVTLSGAAADPNSPALPVAFNWVQTSGPTVLLIPGGTPAGSSASFTAPSVTASTALNFTLVATNSANKSASGSVTVNVQPVAADVVTISSAIWTNATQNRGKLTITAVSTLPPTTPSLTLFVQASVATTTIDPLTGLVVPTRLQLAASPIQMSQVTNVVGQLPLCPAGFNTCWQFTTQSVMSDPAHPGTFLPPDTVTVTSSFGGAATASGTQITLQ